MAYKQHYDDYFYDVFYDKSQLNTKPIQFNIHQKNFMTRTLLGLRQYNKTYPEYNMLDINGRTVLIAGVISKLERYLSLNWYKESDKRWLNEDLPDIARFVHPHAMKELRRRENAGS